MRIAKCSCGSLSLQLEGAPVATGICSCKACQRRTGTAFSYAGFWPENQVSRSGPATEWTRAAESGRTLTSRFCPTCGTTVWWTAELFPGLIGIALGSTEHADLTPSVAVWDKHRAPWLELPHGIATHPEGRG